MIDLINNREDAVRRYVTGRLGSEALDEFEAALFDDASLVAAVEEDRALRTGMRALDPYRTLKKRPDDFTSRTKRWWPIAAAYLIGATSILLLQFQTVEKPGSVVSNVPVLLLETIRSASPSRRIFRIEADASQLVLQIPVVPHADARFRLAILDSKGAELLVVDDLQADSDSVLCLLVPAGKLPPGDFRAQVERKSGDEYLPESQMEFRIEKLPRP